MAYRYNSIIFLIFIIQLLTSTVYLLDAGEKTSEFKSVNHYYQSTFDYLSSTWIFRFLHNFVDYFFVIIPAGVLVYLVKQTNLCPLFVSKNRLIRLFVFGVDSGEDYVLLDKKLPSVKSDLITNRRFSKLLENKLINLLYCFFGLQISYLTWGILQEKIMTQDYRIPNTFFDHHKEISLSLIKLSKNDDFEQVGSAITSFKFQNAQFLVFINRILAFVIATSTLVYQNRKSLAQYFYNTNQPAFYMYMYCSFSNILSSWCQYEALKYVSFPVQVLSKGCKMIPVMIMAQFLRGKTHKKAEWMFALSISFGLSIFMFNEHKESPPKEIYDDNSPWMLSGLIILALYLTFDSFTSNWQSVLFDEYKISTMHMMAAVNLYSVLFTSVSLIQQSDFFSAIQLLFANPTLLNDCILLSICSATGQMFIFYTISTLGAIQFTMIMTLRQAFAILLSCVIYSHPVSLLGYVGIFIVFASLFGKIFYNSKIKRRKT